VYVDKSEGKGVPVHVMRTYNGGRRIAPQILNFGTRWGEGSNSRPCRFTPERIPMESKIW
jgi:hypothetical protein